MDYCSTVALQQIISVPLVPSYISEIKTEVGRRAREQKGLGWIKKEGNYVMVQFISIKSCQELPDNSSGWVDPVIKYVMWEPNKFLSYIFSMTVGKLFMAQESDKFSLCSCTEVKTQQSAAAFWKERVKQLWKNTNCYSLVVFFLSNGCTCIHLPLLL